MRIEWLMADLAIETSRAAKAAVKTHYPRGGVRRNLY